MKREIISLAINGEINTNILPILHALDDDKKLEQLLEFTGPAKDTNKKSGDESKEFSQHFNFWPNPFVDIVVEGFFYWKFSKKELKKIGDLWINPPYLYELYTDGFTTGAVPTFKEAMEAIVLYLHKI